MSVMPIEGGVPMVTGKSVDSVLPIIIGLLELSLTILTPISISLPPRYVE